MCIVGFLPAINQSTCIRCLSGHAGCIQLVDSAGFPRSCVPRLFGPSKFQSFAMAGTAIGNSATPRNEATFQTHALSLFFSPEAWELCAGGLRFSTALATEGQCAEVCEMHGGKAKLIRRDWLLVRPFPLSPSRHTLAMAERPYLGLLWSNRGLISGNIGGGPGRGFSSVWKQRMDGQWLDAERPFLS